MRNRTVMLASVLAVAVTSTLFAVHGRTRRDPADALVVAAAPSAPPRISPPPVPVTVPSPVVVALPRPSTSPRARPERDRRTGTVAGTVTDSTGRPLDGISVMSLDLDTVLGRTSSEGAFSVPCQEGLVFAAYAFGPEGRPGVHRHGEPTTEGRNLAFRIVHGCPRNAAVRLPVGGVVEGKADADPGRQVWLSRVTAHGDYADGTGRFGDFEATVREDGTYRIEGLATGRYSIESSYEGFPDEATFVDVHEGSTSDGSYTYYMDPAICHEQPDSPDCAPPSD